MGYDKHSKAVINFPNYTVRTDGKVFNKNEHELKQTVNRDGYSMVKLCNKGYEKNCLVHRLVAEAFIPNPDNKRTVNHIDGNKTNNDISNLEWCTHSENEKHAYANSLRRSYLTYSDRKNGAVISKEKRRKPVKVIETGIIYPSVLDCAKDLGCYTNGVAGCCNGIYKQHHNYHFEWAKEEQK